MLVPISRRGISSPTGQSYRSLSFVSRLLPLPIPPPLRSSLSPCQQPFTLSARSCSTTHRPLSLSNSPSHRSSTTAISPSLPIAIRSLNTLSLSSSFSPNSPSPLFSSRARTTPTLINLQRRSFHPSTRRQDVFFVAVPALKGTLLNITRFTLLFLPFVFRYRLWKRYKRASYLLIQIPIFAICIVFALGLDQCPRTGRWRLLLMSENEEMAWSLRKHQEVLRSDGAVLLPPTDPRSSQVARVTTRLVTALEEQEHHIVCGATWPPRSSELGRVINEREAALAGAHNHGSGSSVVAYVPSGTARSTFMPWRPASSNPLKHLESEDWNLYVIDLPQVNAFALPSKDVFVYTGLLNTLPDDDAMLAAVLAHEIAHVTQRHSVENLGFLNVAAVLFDVLRGISFALTISFPFITDSAGMLINWLNDVVAERAYSRKLEMEADAVGLEIMALAGYDPRAMLDLWELMSAVEADAAASGHAISIENRFALLRTHPTSENRQKAIDKLLPKAMEIWEANKSHRSKSSTTTTTTTATAATTSSSSSNSTSNKAATPMVSEKEATSATA